MKKIIVTLLIFFAAANILIAQTQERIPWPSLADSPWPVGRGDVQGTGRSEYIGPSDPVIYSTVSYPFGILKGPVLGENSELYFGSFGANFGENHNYFYCSDSMGNEMWRYETNGFVANDGVPAIGSDGTVYFGSQNGNFYALNSDGSLNWKYKTDDGFYQDNILMDKTGNIYVSNHSSIISLSSAGNERFKLQGLSSPGLALSPAGSVLYANAFDLSGNNISSSLLIAIDTSGVILWQKRFNRLPIGSILVDNAGYLYFQAEPYNPNEAESWLFYSLDASGETRWTFGNKDVSARSHWGSPTMDGEGNITFRGAVRAEDNFFRSALISIDYNGSLRWFHVFEIEHWFNYPSVDINHGLVSDANGTIYAVASYGYYLYALSSNGEMLWKMDIPNDYYAEAGPILGKDQTIYLGMHKSSWVNDLTDNLLIIKNRPSSADEEPIRLDFALGQNYPNPFNPTTKISYSVPKQSAVKLAVYNLLGEELAVLVDENKEPGKYDVEFSAENLSSGVYFYVLESGKIRITKKMMMIK